MAVELNHTIIMSENHRTSATFFADLLGLPPPKPFGPFLVVELDNGVSLDFLEADGPIAPQHYAFLVTEGEFDEILTRIQEHDLDYWPDPHLSRKGEINHHDGGRGTYFKDPNGHLLEIITRPYGGGS
jgi:catechol 2,3-dioxygenase-like lactoylglutathione lyase family enzyme